MRIKVVRPRIVVVKFQCDVVVCILLSVQIKRIVVPLQVDSVILLRSWK